MQLGDHNTAERADRGGLDVALNAFNAALDKLIDAIESGGLDQLTAAEKISFWQRFETSRNRLPLIDHQLIADADASDLAGECCLSNLRMLLTRTLQLSPAEAAARVRAAAAMGPRTSELGEAVDPVLPHLAAAQRIGQVVCRYHHTHFLQKGWTCRINADGLPEWIPPRWIDPEQRPQLHTRIRRLHTKRQFSGRRLAKAA
jgi:hypothetical protein